MGEGAVIGILGGTFDPPHEGHLRLARHACDAASLDKALLVPARQPPHKERAGMTPPEERFRMTALLAGLDPRLEASDIELRRSGPSYTVDTVRELLAQHPENQYRLILGADMVEIFHLWREAETLVRLAPPLVAERPGTDLPADLVTDGPPELSEEARRILQAGRLVLPPEDISSTAIRDALCRGESLESVPGPVLRFIREHGLYVR